MNDDLAARFAGIDDPRPLPARLRAALERELTGDLAMRDAARPMPVAMRDRLESALLAGVGERPVPVPVRRRLRMALLGAAALIVLTGAVAVLTGSAERATTTAAGGARNQTAAAGGQSDASQVDSSDGLSAGQGANGGSATDGATAAGGSGAATGAARAASGQAIAVRVVGGDRDDEAGFRAYVDFANRSGGPRLTVTDAPAASVVVNLSELPMEPPANAVLLEGLAAREATLVGNVFAAASVIERQAHIAADAAFPADSPGARAVIVTSSSEPFATRVPSAIEAVLRERGVSALRVRYGDGGLAVLPRADAVFVSLPTDSARAWLREARSRNYAPARGTWGLYSLADDALVREMTDSVRVVSPFAFGNSADATALRDALGKPLSARAVHGWVTAKLLATATARATGTSVPALTRALTQLVGFDDGFAAPYAFRPKTHSRTPEGVVLRPAGGRLVTEGGFARDPR